MSKQITEREEFNQTVDRLFRPRRSLDIAEEIENPDGSITAYDSEGKVVAIYEKGLHREFSQ
jgi:hypothetical protein